jgi:hypothetical protein
LSEEGRKYTTKDCWYKCNVSGGENMWVLMYELSYTGELLLIVH